jgi:hypothetical protein
MMQPTTIKPFCRMTYGIRVLPEHVILYRRARELRDAPIPVDPEARQRRQRAYFEACTALHQALGRTDCEQCVMETDGDEPPPFIIFQGDMRQADWVKASAIARRLRKLDESGVGLKRQA